MNAMFMVFLVALQVFAAAMAPAADKTVIQVTGPDSMFGRLHTLSMLFERENPGMDVRVVRGATVDAVFPALVKGETGVAMASRKINAAEKDAAKAKGVELTENLIGYGGIVIVAHVSNPLNELTVDQVKKLLSGEYTNWSECGAPPALVKVFRVGEKHPGTLVFMQEDFLGKPLASGAEVMPDFAGVMTKVSGTPGAIGFVRIRDAFECPGQAVTKVMKIRAGVDGSAVLPCRGTVSDGSYPIRRPYYLYSNSRVSAEISKYIEYIKAKGWGQQTL